MLAFSHPTGDVSDPLTPNSAAIVSLLDAKSSRPESSLNVGYRAITTRT